MSKNSIKKIKEIFEELDCLFLITNVYSEILYGNKELEAKYGFSKSEIKGKKPGELWGGKMPKDFYKNMWKTLIEDKKPFNAKVTNSKKSGEKTNALLSIIPILNENNQPEYFVQLQPKIENDLQLEKFQTEFNQLFSDKTTNAEDVINALKKWSKKNEFKQINEFKKDSLTTLESLFLESNKLNLKEDQRLINKAKHNSEEFEELYTKYYKEIYNFINSRNPNSDLSKDFTQESFIKAFEALQNFKISDASYKTYLFTIAKNILINHHKKKKTAKLENLNEIEDKTKKSLKKTLDDKKIWEKVEKLSKDDQEVIKLKYQKDLKIKDIAQKLGKSENAIKLRISRAKKKLKNL